MRGGEGPREWVTLTVRDTGTGMGNESLAHIFEPFFTTKEIGKGTGMGLATVYGIVQHSGGRIEVESELGNGTTFRVYLPRTLETAINMQEAEETELARGHETLLVVEDERAILKITRTTLQRLGYSVISAASAGEALALAAGHEGPLHLLLTDVVMPEMNGLDLYTRIAASHAGIGVIFMSGYSAESFPRSNDGRGVSVSAEAIQHATVVRQGTGSPGCGPIAPVTEMKPRRRAWMKLTGPQLYESPMPPSLGRVHARPEGT